MLEKPHLKDEKVIDCTKAGFDLSVKNLGFRFSKNIKHQVRIERSDTREGGIEHNHQPAEF